MTCTFHRRSKYIIFYLFAFLRVVYAMFMCYNCQVITASQIWTGVKTTLVRPEQSAPTFLRQNRSPVASLTTAANVLQEQKTTEEYVYVSICHILDIVVVLSCIKLDLYIYIGGDVTSSLTLMSK